MEIEICYSSSGFGLENDALLLAETLNGLGYASSITNVPKPSSYSLFQKFYIYLFRAVNGFYLYRCFLRTLNLIKRDTLIIHLENLSYLKILSRNIHVLIPNQEWYDPNRLELLKLVHTVWCKTRLAESIFVELGCKTQYIGFRSKVGSDLIKNNQQSTHFFSRVGMSANRGANVLVDTWGKHPEWPTLKLLIHQSRRPEPKPANVEYLDLFESQSDYNKVASESLFHIYLTETEGFGHSIVEALGYGAIIIAQNAPPMNEILNTDCALLVESRYIGQKSLSPRFGAQEASLERAVDQALTLSQEEVCKLSRRARSRYLTLASQFPKSLENALLGATKRNH